MPETALFVNVCMRICNFNLKQIYKLTNLFYKKFMLILIYTWIALQNDSLLKPNVIVLLASLSLSLTSG